MMGDRMNQTINPNSTAQGEAPAELESHQNAAQQELCPPGHTPVPHTREKNEARNSKSLNVMQTTSIHRVVTALIATWVALCLSGCASFELAEVEMPWSEGEEELAEVPERIVSFWSDTVLHQKGLPGVRGFGGRVFFYGSEGEDPIKVDGALVVYAFDAEHNDPAHQKPLKKFVFTADQLAKHQSHTKIGDSYSVWLPWDEVGGPTRSVSLVARFEGRDGGVVISDPVDKLLPGVNSKDRMYVEHGQRLPHFLPNGVRPAAYSSVENQPAQQQTIEPKKHLKTEEIDLPPSFSRRLRYAVDSEDSAQTRSGSAQADSAQFDSSQSRLPSSVPLSSPRATETSSDGGVVTEVPASDRAEDSLAADYRYRRFPARRKVGQPPDRDRVRRGLHPATWPSALPPTPRSGLRAGSGKRTSTFPLAPPPLEGD